MVVPQNVAAWMMQRAPDVEGLLAAAFGGTGLLQGGLSDYVLALAIAIAFPIMRWIMDRKVYGVSGAATAPAGPRHRWWVLLLRVLLGHPLCNSSRACRPSPTPKCCGCQQSILLWI